MTSKLALALPQLQRLQCHQVTQLDALITIAIMMMMPLTMAIENLNLFRRKVGTRTRRHEVEDPRWSAVQILHARQVDVGCVVGLGYLKSEVNVIRNI